MRIDESFPVVVTKVSYDQISGGKHQKYWKIFSSVFFIRPRETTGDHPETNRTPPARILDQASFLITEIDRQDPFKQSLFGE